MKEFERESNKRDLRERATKKSYDSAKREIATRELRESYKREN